MQSADELRNEARRYLDAIITVVLVDDHWMMRAGLRALLVELGGIEIVGEASNGREAIDMVAKHRPRLVLMDRQGVRPPGSARRRLGLYRQGLGAAPTRIRN
jgi:DNA-binding NarL/FixJ family response regulator